MLVYQRIAQLVDAYKRCDETDNSTWKVNHAESIGDICYNHLPHGSGFDNGSHVDLGTSKPDRLVICTSYHHMDENGMYCGWSDHNVIVTPSLAHGFDLRVTGRDKRDIKDYIAETFDYMLREEID